MRQVPALLHRFANPLHRLADAGGTGHDVTLCYKVRSCQSTRNSCRATSCELLSRSRGSYGLKPYREAGRRSTTIQVRAPKTFHDQTLWPEYRALSAELDAHLRELTERVIREAIDDDVSEADEAPKALPPASR